MVIEHKETHISLNFLIFKSILLGFDRCLLMTYDLL